jgi:redox-sensitive bicupin YhaK (pirin superfamily)
MDGESNRITGGGVQWLTAGSGLIHSEQCSEEFKTQGGEIEILQLWINLPSGMKTAKSGYVGLQRDQIPSYELKGGKGFLHLISGHLNGRSGPIEPLSNANVAWLEMEKGGRFETSVNEEHEVLLYVANGSVNINGESTEGPTVVKFKHQNEKIEISATANSTVLLGHAMPNNEPVVARGPFVMSSEEEVEMVINNYWNGNFGNNHE